jgi:hypothetical protein
MPIDPSIALGVRPVQTPNMLANYAQAQEIGVNQLKMQEAQQSIENRNFIRGLDPDAPDYISKIMQRDPKLGMELRKNQLEGKKGQVELEANLMKNARNTLAPINDQGTYDLWRQQTILQLPSVAQFLPAKFDKDVKTALMLEADKYIGQTTLTKNQQETLNIQNKQLGVSQGNLDVARQNLTKPQYIQTNDGLVAVPNVLKPGQTPTGIPVMGANGENLGRPLKDIPAVASRAITENQIALNKVRRAIDLNEGKEITLPNGNKIQGDSNATGFIKGLTPQVILNSWDPQGVDTRAFIADIGSLKIHDRSGAAVTASETPRLKPFIPSISDSKDTAIKKLKQFEAEYQDMENSFAEMYSRDQGYRPNPSLLGKGSNAGGNRPSLDSIFNPK